MNISNTHRELFRSCEILFGSELHVCREFLDYLEISGVKSAFRKRAMETHPDRHAGKDLQVRRENTAIFYAVREAYENILEFLREKERSEQSSESRRPTAPCSYKPNSGRANHNRRKPEPPPYRPIEPIILTDEISRNTRFSNTERYYQGSLPRRQLLFGHFLYYSGLANWRTIARILTWQRTERPRIGELGRRFGIFDQEDILTIMHYKKPFSPFGQTARMLGLLSEQQLKVLIFQQQRLQKKFGAILLEKNLLKDYELQELLYQFECHNENILTQGRQ
jgi:curved DNA-binding protein CbpA